MFYHKNPQLFSAFAGCKLLSSMGKLHVWVIFVICKTEINHFDSQITFKIPTAHLTRTSIFSDRVFKILTFGDVPDSWVNAGLAQYTLGINHNPKCFQSHN